MTVMKASKKANAESNPSKNKLKKINRTQWMPPGNVLKTTGHVPKTKLNPPIERSVTSTPFKNARWPRAAKTAKPATKENMELASETTVALRTAGSSRGQWLPKAVKIPKVSPIEKKI